MILLLISLSLFLTGSHTPTALEKTLQAGRLTIVSRNGPTTYFEGPNGFDGYEYHLAKAFADSLGVDLEIREESNLSELLDAAGTEEGQFSAAGITVTEERRQKVRFTYPYLQVRQQLLYRSGNFRPRTIEDLYGKNILVISNSSHVETLRNLQKDYPRLRWNEQSNLDMIELIEMVNNGDIDYTIVDSNAFDLNRVIYPRAKVAFDVTESEDLAWAFPQSDDDSLYKLANAFLKNATDMGLLDQITDIYYGQIAKMDMGSAVTFTRRLENRLPLWEEHLKQAAALHDIDWMLLAAMSYQESHWDAKAVSSTGVRGLMMLTQITAREMGITNRSDPVQSIYGGAKYFRKIYDRIPTSVNLEDRQWMALAAYNIGFGHLRDARTLARREGLNPDIWDDLEKVLPLLAKRKYYSTLPHGYARGWEPVAYVNNIRNFHKTIAWHQQVQQSRLATSRGDDLEDLTPPPLNEQAKSEKGTSLL